MTPKSVIRSIWKWWTGIHPTADNRLMRVCPQYRDLARQERAARDRHSPTRHYAKARTALVTELLRGER